MNKELLVQFLIVTIENFAVGKLNSNDENVCLSQNKYLEKVYVYVTVPTTVTTTSWCWNPVKGFRCETTKSEQKIIQEPREVERTRFELKCCSGYYQMNDSKCSPICSEQCIHGTCLKPFTCDCDSGYHGPDCVQQCPTGSWGRNCLENCDCHNGATCNIFNGLCTCSPGWRGERCDWPCTEGYYGSNCDKKCECYLGECHHVTGACYQVVTENLPDNSVINKTAELQSNHSRTFETAEGTENRESNESDTSKFYETPTTYSASPSSKSAKKHPYKEVIPKTEHETGETSQRYGSEEETNLSNSEELNLKGFFFTTTVSEVDKTDQAPTDYVTDLPADFSLVTTFTEEIATSGANPIFRFAETDGYNLEENGNVRPFDVSTEIRETDNYDDNFNDNAGIGGGEVMKEEKNNGVEKTTEISLISDVRVVKGEKPRRGPPEISEKEIDMFNRFNSYRFVPSLSVLTGVTILIIIIGARWLALQRRRKNKKILAKQNDEFLNGKENRKYRDSLIIGNGFPENHIILHEVNLIEERPILQTFKPLPDV